VTEPVRPFELGRLPRVTFGPGRIAAVPEIVAGHGRHVLLVTGRQSFRAGPRHDELLDGLERAGVAVDELVVEGGEPSPDLVDEAVRRHRGTGIDVVLGIGGGSVLDAAKAIAGLLDARTTALDHLEGVGAGLAYEGPPVPFVAVPTTAGTGSEATRNAVLSRRGPDGFKKSFRDERLVARDAVVDPDLLVGLPPRRIADNGMDALAQLLESYTSTRASPLTDALALTGLRAVRDGLVPWFDAVVSGADDPAGRSSMALAALLSGMTLAHTGLGSVHGLASPLGARFEIGHGAACGATLVAATRVNLEALADRDPDGPGLARYADAGRALSGLGHLGDGAGRAALMDTLEGLAARLDIGGLSRFGVGEAGIPGLVAEARGTSMRTNPIVLTDDEVERILRDSL
jgi:alcohol dehydrogenase class IV